MENNILGMISAFIAITIMLSIGITILGNSVQDCSNLPGYDKAIPTNSTGWASTCLDNASQSQSSYQLLIVVLVVIAAVAIISVVRMLG